MWLILSFFAFCIVSLFLLTRFNVELDKETSTFILRIRDIQETDGATYQCQVLQIVGRRRRSRSRRRKEEKVEKKGVDKFGNQMPLKL